MTTLLTNGDPHSRLRLDPQPRAWQTLADPMSARDDDAPNRPQSMWLEALAERGRTKVFPARTIIIHEGEAGDLIYLIKSGTGKIYSANEAGKEIVFGNFGPGDTLGEPTLDGGRRSASVMTLEKTTCSVLHVDELQQLIEERPALAMDVIFTLIRLLRSANETVKSLALDDVYGRVVRFLMKSATPVDGHWVIHERLTQQYIADRVGSSREMVSRIFKDLEKGDYLAVERERIVIRRKPPPGW